MEQRLDGLRPLQQGQGRVVTEAVTRLVLPPGGGYANAQLDDYGRLGSRRAYPWRPGTRLSLRARFSGPQDELVGTAGFGFWNAPFGDPSIRRPALPQATWFFFASPPTDLPLPESGPGQGWFAATVDASRPQAVALAPLAPLVLLLNQSAALRQRIWPRLRQQLGVSFAPLAPPLDAWHNYELEWRPSGCTFAVDGEVVHATAHAPSGPLGLVIWIDNQYLVATPRGRLGWGVLPVPREQWLEISDLSVHPVTAG
jgi:hypothetical protein